MHSKQSGFTIVELLIVIVVIGILAAVVITSFAGAQGKAHDAAIRSDLKNVAAQFKAYEASNGSYPYGTTQLSDPSLKLKVTKNAYGNHYVGGANLLNMLYCRRALDGPPSSFALIGSSKSGKVFVYKSNGGLSEHTGAWGGSSTAVCQSVGINQTDINDRDFFYLNTWATYIQD